MELIKEERLNGGNLDATLNGSDIPGRAGISSSALITN
jgi:hypothetical protein